MQSEWDIETIVEHVMKFSMDSIIILDLEILSNVVF